MLTPTHWLIGATAARARRRSRPDPDVKTPSERIAATADPPSRWSVFADRIAHDRRARRAWLWGAVAPDLPLYALSLGSAVWFPATRGWSLGRTFAHVFDDLFFTHPVWMAANSLLHSPVSLALLTAATWRSRSLRIRAFLLGAALHTAVDIPVHHDDGPLLLWPFEWSVRFRSPVSYWDPRHHGQVFGVFEYALIAALVVYLWRTRAGRHRTDADVEPADLTPS